MIIDGIPPLIRTIYHICNLSASRAKRQLALSSVSALDNVVPHHQ